MVVLTLVSPGDIAGDNAKSHCQQGRMRWDVYSTKNKSAAPLATSQRLRIRVGLGLGSYNDTDNGVNTTAIVEEEEYHDDARLDLVLKGLDAQLAKQDCSTCRYLNSSV